MVLIASLNSDAKDPSGNRSDRLSINSKLLENMSESTSSTVELHQDLSGSLQQHSKLLPRIPNPCPRSTSQIPKPPKPTPKVPDPPPKPPESSKPPASQTFEPPPSNAESPPPPNPFHKISAGHHPKNETPLLSTPEPPDQTIEIIQRSSRGEITDRSLIDTTALKELTSSKTASVMEVGDTVTETLEEDQYKPVTMTNIQAILITLLAGGIAGGVARTLTAPVDFSKRDYYVHGTHEPYSLHNAIRRLEETYKLKGIRVFYKANMFGMIRAIPFSAIQFTAHRRWKDFLKVGPDSPKRLRIGAGALAGVTALTITYPIDLTLAQMYMLESDDMDTFFKALRNVWKRGRIRALYRGYFPSILGIIPYSGISFFTYDGLKYRFVDTTRRTPSLYFMLFGAFAGFLGTTTAYPMDVIRRHMQMSTPLDSRFKTFRGTVMAIFRTRGVRGFYDGLSINWIKGPVTVGVSFATFDKILETLKRNDESFGSFL